MEMVPTGGHIQSTTWWDIYLNDADAEGNEEIEANTNISNNVSTKCSVPGDAWIRKWKQIFVCFLVDFGL